MTPNKPSKINGVPIPHDASLEELLEQIKAPAPDCAPAYIALGCRSEPSALYSLLEATKNEDWHVRRVAAAALRYCPLGRRALPALELLLSDDQNEVIRTTCETMGVLGIMSERLIYLLQVRDEPKTRATALKVLDKLGQRQIFDYVVKVYERETFPEVREAAAAYLLKYVTEENWRDLFDLLVSDVQSQMRVRACGLVKKYGDSSCVDEISDLLTDDDDKVRKAAYTVLTELNI